MDQFNHTELANNWDKVDAHDHSTGKGLPISAAGLANGLKPSSGATDSTESLRALGTTSGTAAPGNHARIVNLLGPNDFVTIPHVKAGISTTSVAADGAGHKMTLATPVWTPSMWSAGSPTRLTVSTPGVYTIHGSIEFGNMTGSSDVVYVSLLRNNINLMNVILTYSGNTTVESRTANPNVVWPLSANDYIELSITKTNTDGLSQAIGIGTGFLQMAWVGRAV